MHVLTLQIKLEGDKQSFHILCGAEAVRWQRGSHARGSGSGSGNGDGNNRTSRNSKNAPCGGGAKCCRRAPLSLPHRANGKKKKETLGFTSTETIKAY